MKYPRGTLKLIDRKSKEGSEAWPFLSSAVMVRFLTFFTWISLIIIDICGKISVKWNAWKSSSVNQFTIWYSAAKISKFKLIKV